MFGQVFARDAAGQGGLPFCSPYTSTGGREPVTGCSYVEEHAALGVFYFFFLVLGAFSSLRGATG